MPAGSGWGRRVTTTASAVSAGAVPRRWARARRLASSDQCRSSSTTSTGPAWAAPTTAPASRSEVLERPLLRAEVGLRRRRRVVVDAELREHRPPGPQRRGAVVLRAAPDADAHAGGTRLGDQLVDQPGLAQAGLADHGRGREGAGPGAVEDAAERRALGVAADGLGRRGPDRLDRRRAGSGVVGSTGSTSVVVRGRTSCRPGAWRSTASSRVRSSAPGSRPSSSASTPRTVRSASRASAWRPARTSARACSAQTRSRSWWRPVIVSVADSTLACSPSASRPSSRSSSAEARSCSSDARSASTSGWSGRSAYGSPCQSARAASSPSRAAVTVARSGQPVVPPAVSCEASGASTGSAARTRSAKAWASMSPGATRST